MAARVVQSKIDFGFDLDRYVERQFGHADRRARVLAALRAKHRQDQVGKSVDHGWRRLKSRRHVDHAEGTQPSDMVEAAEFALEARHHAQGCQLSGVISLLKRHLAPDFPKRPGNRAIRQARTMSGNRDALADYPHPAKRQSYSHRDFGRCRQFKAQFRKLLLNRHFLACSFRIIALLLRIAPTDAQRYENLTLKWAGWKNPRVI